MKSQNDKIEDYLTKNINKWVSMPDLVKCSGSYNVHTRISELRKRGHKISNRIEAIGRLRHSYYRLEPQN